MVMDSAPEIPRGGGGGGARKSGGKRKGGASSGDGLAAATDAQTLARADIDMDDADGGGKTLGERVRALETNAGDAPTRDGTETSEKARSARGGEALNPSADDAAALAVAEALNGTKGAPPKADSLAVLLSQALVAEDRALIERCLSVSDPTVVDNTTSRLAPHAATRLLGAALDRMRTKPARGEQLARWMRTVMLHHAGYIASSTKAQAQLVELQRTVESHVAMQRPLSSLLGRLDLLLHRRGGGDEDGNGDGDGDENGPVSTYDEGDEDVDVVEDALDDGDDSEDEWETDEDALDDGDDSEDEEDDSDLDDEDDSE